MTDPLVDVLTLRKRSDPQGALTVNEMDANWTELGNRVALLFRQLYGVGVPGDGVLNPTTGEITTNIAGYERSLPTNSSSPKILQADASNVKSWVVPMSLLDVLQVVYPVWSYYLSASATNPKTIFGFGTWVQITDMYLAAAGSTLGLGAQLGSGFSKTLTNAEIPEHSHSTGGGVVTTGAGGAHDHAMFSADTDADHSVNGSSAVACSRTAITFEFRYDMGAADDGSSATLGRTSSSATHTHTFTIPTGNSGNYGSATPTPIEIKPSYLGLYVYQRTA